MTTPLAREIRALIAAEGPMPVSRYMALCLEHPEFGYYITRDPLGAQGDFITAPEISQMFGELLGLWAVSSWQQMGMPPLIRLIELGPGRGTLMADAMRAARLSPDFIAAVQVHLVETSPALRERQEETLIGLSPSWHDRIEDVPEGPALVLANEFFDALPVNQFVRTATGWHERRVGLDAEDNLIFGLDPQPLAALDAIAAPFPPAQDGAVLERMESGPMEALARRIATQGGGALIIDYGHMAHGFGDTLQAMKAHSFVDPLAEPGEADLTAHVDFAALAEVARRAGARAFGPLLQGDFLIRLGLAARAARLKKGADDEQSAAIDTDFDRLSGGGPNQMGRLFKVLALSDDALAPPRGFEPDEEIVS